MPSVIDTLIADTLYPLESDFFGLSVVVRRANSTGDTVTAIVNKTEFEVLNAEGALTVIAGREYTIARADYKISGAVVTPLKGDVITEGSTRFMVQSIPGFPAVEDEDADKVRWIVRAKED